MSSGARDRARVMRDWITRPGRFGCNPPLETVAQARPRDVGPASIIKDGSSCHWKQSRVLCILIGGTARGMAGLDRHVMVNSASKMRLGIMRSLLVSSLGLM